MVVGGSQQETLDPCSVLFGTRQQGVPPSKSQYIVPAVSSHLDWWPHCNMIDSIRSALISTRQACH
ncbi:unnamed protein product [Schistosoma margrebowiei]|uniref:Uncharacterized protein n=1 Tax=Schistosoma margrebowiei TaxID=48269 RepID=A0A183M792_9TREM|nr:unnamed protein product [Schistosoma margrebowiei]